MRIGIDALSIIPGRIAGGETYLYSLARALELHDSANEYVVFVTPQAEDRFRHVAPRFTRVICKAAGRGVGWRVLWEQFRLRASAEAFKLDVMFFPGNTAWFKPSRTCATVVTVHDLVHKFYETFSPGSLGRFRTAYLDLSIRRACGVADRIVTISESSARQIREFAPAAAGKVRVVAHGVQIEELGDPLHASSSRSPAAAFRPYILSLGTFQRHKNLATLVEAFALLRQKHGVPHALALAGRPGPATGEIRDLIRRRGLEEHVQVLGQVASAEIGDLYRRASVFAFPSLYEGFGFPVLEAMIAGCPVVSSDRASLPEVVEEAGLLVPALDPVKMADALYAVLSDEALRERLVTRGRAHVRRYTWERSALRHLEVFKEACLARKARSSAAAPAR